MIKLTKRETMLYLTCKGWEIDDEELYESLRDTNYNEDLDTWEIEGNRSRYGAKIKLLKEYPLHLKYYLAVYCCDLVDVGVSVYTPLLQDLGDLVFRIDPKEFKKAMYGGVGIDHHPLLQCDPFISLRSVISIQRTDMVEIDPEGAPRKFKEKYLK